MHSLNRLYLRTAGDREFVLCTVNSPLPEGVSWEAPAECLWSLRGAGRHGQVFGVRDFLAREGLVSVLGYPSDGDESMRVLEEMIERRVVAGYFPEGDGMGENLSRALGSGALPSLSFPDVPSPEDLLDYAQSFVGGKAAPRTRPNPPARTPPTTPASGFETGTENGPPAAASSPGDLVAVVTQFLGSGTTPKASKPNMGAAAGTKDGSPSVDAEDLGLVASQTPARDTAPQMQDYVLRVVDDEGKPVAGVEIIFGPSAADPKKTTDADGWVKTTSPQASMEISFKLPAARMG